MIVEIERNGGLAGISTSKKMEVNDLPSALINAVKKIMDNTITNSSPLKISPKGASDYYTYKITIKDGTKHKVIECTEYTMQDELKSLIKFAEKNSTK